MPTQGPNKRKPANSDDKTAKRSRVSRACDQCRVAREKCDGVQPMCFTCTASQRDCTYTANPKKRGIQQGYIRSLELSLTWLFQNTDSEALLNKKLAQEGASSVLLGRNSKDSNKLHKSWRKSRFCKDIDKLLSGVEIDGCNDSRTPDSDDEDTDAESTAPNVQYETPLIRPPEEQTSLGIQRIYTGDLSPPIAHTVLPREPVDASSSNYPFTASQPQENVIPQPTLLPSNRWRLFDLYFAYTHCWFPICEKHDVLKLTYSYPEHGLVLSPTKLSNTGDHAELWSILALASIQELHTNSTESRHNMDTDESTIHHTPFQLYDIARSLIPLEKDAFELGHVKALLILALFNLSQSASEAAWMVVSHATRIIVTLKQDECSHTSRFKHVFAGCFLLDILTSVQLRRRPYLQTIDVEQIGRVSEDGLEEWQPWAGCIDSGARNTSRTPVFSLSTFNKLVQIAGVLEFMDSRNSALSLQEATGQIETWRASLPPTFDYIRSERVATPSTPPALLLQLTYHCSSLVLFTSQSWIHRILEILEHFRNVLGLIAMPPVLHCLVKIVQSSQGFESSDQGLQGRFKSMQSEFTQAWTPALHSGSQAPIGSHSKRSFGSANAQIPRTPESIQIPYNQPFIPITDSSTHTQRVTNTNLLDDLLPDMNPTPMGFQNALVIPNFETPHLEQGFNQPLLYHRNSNASRDLENFFDELASLDGAERVDNQPQFMQNLGFAPDANMADLLTAEFGQFGSLNPVYVPPNDNSTHHMDPSAFYDGS